VIPPYPPLSGDDPFHGSRERELSAVDVESANYSPVKVERVERISRVHRNAEGRLSCHHSGAKSHQGYLLPINALRGTAAVASCRLESATVGILLEYLEYFSQRNSERLGEAVGAITGVSMSIIRPRDSSISRFLTRSVQAAAGINLAGRAELLQMAYNAVSGAMADGCERSRGIIPAALGNA